MCWYFRYYSSDSSIPVFDVISSLMEESLQLEETEVTEDVFFNKYLILFVSWISLFLCLRDPLSLLLLPSHPDWRRGISTYEFVNFWNKIKRRLQRHPMYDTDDVELSHEVVVVLLRAFMKTRTSSTWTQILDSWITSSWWSKRSFYVSSVLKSKLYQFTTSFPTDPHSINYHARLWRHDKCQDSFRHVKSLDSTVTDSIFQHTVLGIVSPVTFQMEDL